MAKTHDWEIVEASFSAAANIASSLPAQMGVEVAFAGRSNVGKSSLLNALMSRRNLVRTSSTPGCTRQINFFQAKARDGAVFQMVDLPGYGYAKRSKTERAAWADLIDHYLLERDWLRAVVLLIDSRRGISEDEQGLAGLLAQRKRGTTTLISVATKIDKVKKSQRQSALRKLTAGDSGIAIGTSAAEGIGLEALWKAIRKATFIG